MSGEEETTTDDITLSRDYFRKPLGKTLIQKSEPSILPIKVMHGPLAYINWSL